MNAVLRYRVFALAICNELRAQGEKGTKYVKTYSRTSKTVKIKALKSGTATIRAKAKVGG